MEVGSAYIHSLHTNFHPQLCGTSSRPQTSVTFLYFQIFYIFTSFAGNRDRHDMFLPLLLLAAPQYL